MNQFSFVKTTLINIIDWERENEQWRPAEVWNYKREAMMSPIATLLLIFLLSQNFIFMLILDSL